MVRVYRVQLNEFTTYDEPSSHTIPGQYTSVCVGIKRFLHTRRAPVVCPPAVCMCAQVLLSPCCLFPLALAFSPEQPVPQDLLLDIKFIVRVTQKRALDSHVRSRISQTENIEVGKRLRKGGGEENTDKVGAIVCKLRHSRRIQLVKGHWFYPCEYPVLLIRVIHYAVRANVSQPRWVLISGWICCFNLLFISYLVAPGNAVNTLISISSVTRCTHNMYII